MRILVVEDEPTMASLIRQGLTEEGHAVDVTARGEDACWMAQATSYDTIVLDVMLPGISGFTTCAQLRVAGVQSPVLILTARGDLADRVAGLDAGADDYLAKPFELDELLARLRALARRGAIATPPQLSTGPLRLDPAAHRAWHGDIELELSTKELHILELLMRHPDCVVSRFAILEYAWDGDYDNRSNVIDVHIASLRGKIDKTFGDRMIETVRGVGYRLRTPT